MDINDVKGLVIFAGIVGVYSFVLLGCLAKHVKKIQRLIDKQIEENDRYIN